MALRAAAAAAALDAAGGADFASSCSESDDDSVSGLLNAEVLVLDEDDAALDALREGGDVLVIEASDSEGDASDFERKVRRRVAQHFRDQREAAAAAELAAREDRRRQRRERRAKRAAAAAAAVDTRTKAQIRWDKEWEALKSSVWGSISFFLPPVLTVPLLWIIRLLVLWPARMFWTTARFAHLVFSISWPVVLEFLANFVQFPHRLLIRVLEYGEGFARRMIGKWIRFKRLMQSIVRFCARCVLWWARALSGAATRGLRRVRRRIRRSLRALTRNSPDVLGSIRAGLRRLVYLILLPGRLTWRSILSCASAGRLTFASFANLPRKIVYFVVNSPHIFGRSGRRLLRFMRNNKQDILDVGVALVFLVLAGAIISGLFFPLLGRTLHGSVLLLQHMRDTLSRLRLPRLRLPRFNVAKLKQLLPSLPFSLPPLPIPDFALLFGFRERTPFEKFMHAVSSFT